MRVAPLSGNRVALRALYYISKSRAGVLGISRHVKLLGREACSYLRLFRFLTPSWYVVW